MPDRKKVIKALEFCLMPTTEEELMSDVCSHDDCPYYRTYSGGKCVNAVCSDALALLKAQEPCEDAVGKQAVISALEGEYSDWNDDYNIPITHCIKAVQSIPSVQAMPLARVMTLEEVQASINPVWIEGGMNGGTWAIMPKTLERSIEFVGNGVFTLYPAFAIDEYNKTWRCWTSRPTDEQREAIPWN